MSPKNEAMTITFVPNVEKWAVISGETTVKDGFATIEEAEKYVKDHGGATEETIAAPEKKKGWG